MQPVTRYAKSGDVHVAYQVFGEGSANLVLAPPFVSNIENYWTFPDLERWLLRLASFARVVMFDKRGTGMSDRVGELPGLDQRIDDLRAVMDAAGMEQAALLGISEGSPLAALFAATYPDRCRALVLYGGFVRFSSWFPTEEAFAAFLGYIDQAWGSGGSLPFFAPSLANDPAAQQWMGRFERLGASPAAVTALMRMNSQIDISGIVSTIRVPTLVIHRTEDVTINVEGGRYPGQAHSRCALYRASRKRSPTMDRRQCHGDRRCDRGIFDRRASAGDGRPSAPPRFSLPTLSARPRRPRHLATAVGEIFSTIITLRSGAISHAFAAVRSRRPATAFLPPSTDRRAACAAPAPLPRRLRSLGIEVRAGLHTGECEMIDDDVGGIAVHIGARVAALAGAGEVLVSGTVKDLVAGSGLRFGDRGSQSLKGVPGEWHIFAVER